MLEIRLKIKIKLVEDALDVLLAKISANLTHINF